MPAPAEVVQWARRFYPKPRVAEDWLNDCYDWIEGELHLDPSTDLQKIIENVELQLLQSDLRDSMVPGTGLPSDISGYDNKRMRGPILVEITAITDIGQSAFTLQNVRQTRIDRADLAGLGRDDDDDEGPIPHYPRSMLRFELSDGDISIKAVEYRRIPELELGETPLGYKIMLRDVLFRRGIAFLEPSSIMLKGYQTEDREALQDTDFVRGLRLRMGLPDAPETQGQAEEVPPFEVARDPEPEQQVRPIAGPANLAARNAPRSPLSERTAPGSSSTSFVQNEVDHERRRKTPGTRSETTGRPADQAPLAVQRSHYFTQPSNDPCTQLASENILSPPSASISSRRIARSPPLEYVGDESENINDQGQEGIASSDEFGDDSFTLDEAALEQLSEVERNATLNLNRSALGSGSALPSGPSSLGSTLVGSGVPLDTDVIEIDDEDDEKENLPMTSRQVRQRLPASQPDDVIDISD